MVYRTFRARQMNSYNFKLLSICSSKKCRPKRANFSIFDPEKTKQVIEEWTFGIPSCKTIILCRIKSSYICTREMNVRGEDGISLKMTKCSVIGFKYGLNYAGFVQNILSVEWLRLKILTLDIEAASFSTRSGSDFITFNRRVRVNIR